MKVRDKVICINEHGTSFKRGKKYIITRKKHEFIYLNGKNDEGWFKNRFEKC
jgi:hypothetical protein